MAPEEVADLKSWLYNNPLAVKQICGRLAVEEEERIRGTDLKKGFAYTRVQDDISVIAIDNYMAIQHALAMPNSVEWLESERITPEQVKQEADSIMAQERHG